VSVLLLELQDKSTRRVDWWTRGDVRRVALRTEDDEWSGVGHEVVPAIDVQKARGPLARHEARFFSTTRARPGTE
jgi:hypothetical protein